jgi:hypothetical protein
LSPKTKNAVREIDIDPGLAETLRQYIGGKQAGRVFEARNGSPISGNNVLKRVLDGFGTPPLPKAGDASDHKQTDQKRDSIREV